MSNWGTTSITVTGPQADRAALRDAPAATARDKLGFSLAPRFPSLRFDAWFDSEAGWPNFAVSAHEGGQRLCQAWFNTTQLAEVPLRSS